MANHTKTPWRVTDRSGQYGVPIVAGKDSETIHVTSIYGSDGVSDTQDEINAAFIVQAVNAHTALVEALKTVETAFFENAESGKVNVGRGILEPVDSNQHPWIPGAKAWPIIEVVRATLKLTNSQE